MASAPNMAAFVEALRAHRIKPYRTKSHRTKAHCAKLHYSKSTVQNCTVQNCFAQKSHCAVLHCAAVQNHTNTNAKKHCKRRAPKSSEHAASAVRFLFLTVLSYFYHCRSISRLSRRSTCRKRRQHSTRRYRDVLRVQNSDLRGQQGRRKRWFCRDRCLCGAILSVCP